MGASFQSVAGRLGLFYNNLITKTTNAVRERLKEDGNLGGISENEVKEAVRSNLLSYMLQSVLGEYGLSNDQIPLLVGGSTFTLVLLISFIILGMNAIQGEG